MPVCHPMLAGPILAFVLASGDGPPAGRAVFEPFEITHTALRHRPFGLAISACGAVFVTRLDADSVTHLELQTGEIVASIAVGAIPTAIAFDRSGDHAFVANQGSASVGIIDVEPGVQRATIPFAGGRPTIVEPSWTTDALFIGDGGPGIRIASIGQRRQAGSIPVPHHVNGLAIASGDTLLYASATGGVVMEIDARSGRIRRRLEVGGKPQEVILSRNGAVLYVANEAGWVDAFDLRSGRSVGRLRLRAGAFGMALGPDGRTLFVGLPDAGIVEIVNARTLQVERSLEVGGRPRRMAFSPAGDVAVIANEAGWVTFVR